MGVSVTGTGEIRDGLPIFEVPDESCVICLEAITEKAVAQPCHHGHFDFLCLMSWLLEEGPQCPLCRANVKQVHYAFTSPTDFKIYHTTQRQSKSTTKPPHTRSLPLRRRRRRPTPPDISPPNPSLLRRKHIYRHKLYSLHIGSTPLTGHRTITSALFSSSPHLQSRARKWIRRELSIFEFLNTRVKNTEYLLKYIITILKYEDIKGSNGVAEDLVTEFLGRENAKLFSHELGSWLGSPYEEVGEWDEVVQYRDVGSFEGVALNGVARSASKSAGYAKEHRSATKLAPESAETLPKLPSVRSVRKPATFSKSRYPLLLQEDG
ncbi:hypothetical protein EJ08DRAFT_694257 [Tothia fuscella]|uniref:RING-type E3 ubiquitin transferase n=1 Tax=Tothia fuscella TaxID=1048955 RepID=A0A9P4U1R5_9PEZI|nr:hypothetical protein EJ08DRAFT_694257 [Tothia fuscella]